MDAWPEARERELKSPPGRHCESLREARALVARLEQTAEQKLREEETDMGMTRKVNVELIRADAAAGLSQTAIAAKHNCARSTVSHYLHAKDRSTAEGTNGETRPSGGNGLELAADEVRKLAALAEARWQSLPFSEKLQLLIAWGVG